MKPMELKTIIEECCNDVSFVYNGKQSGVTSEVLNSIPKFQSWYGDQTKEYENVDDVMADKFFGGKSLIDLANSVKFAFS